MCIVENNIADISLILTFFIFNSLILTFYPRFQSPFLSVIRRDCDKLGDATLHCLAKSTFRVPSRAARR